ncbi:RadC family protein [Swingsia samuiensis]|uniref:DNA repair protein RadC n=1 Tax=Swingsia samuiensis TaxID=1293412 RepID=A0A4Y6UJW3_9PROT|nr:DNA repair protein RadC [Swingsia samuiensis]QDH17883.1 DNA repair protein RadC [Swingsia samuiensis]
MTDIHLKQNKLQSFKEFIETPNVKIDDLILTGRGRYLTDLDILAYIISLCIKDNDLSFLLAQSLLEKFHSFAMVLISRGEDIMSINDMKLSIIPMIKVLQELGLRYNKQRMPSKDIIRNEKELIEYLSSRLSREVIEQFRILFLDDEKSLISDEAQARGTINHTPVYPREVARRALELNATSLILVHNHPSGDPSPSKADLDMTKHIQITLETIGIELFDHFIIGNGVHTSFKKEGFL